MAGRRPVFWPELGQFFREFRDAKGWGERQAVALAKRKGLKALGRTAFRALERGETKNPDPEVLRAVAELYDLPYEDLVVRFVLHRYQIDVRAADGSASTKRMIELERQVATLSSTFEQIRDLARQLSIAVGVGPADEAYRLLDQLKEPHRDRMIRAMRRRVATERARASESNPQRTP